MIGVLSGYPALPLDFGPGGAPIGGSELRGNTPESRLKSVEDFNREQREGPASPLGALKNALVAIGCNAADFDAALVALKKKFGDDPTEVQAELATEFGFGLHNLIGTTGSGPPPAP